MHSLSLRCRGIAGPAALWIAVLITFGCTGQAEPPAVKTQVPRGYQQTLQIQTDDRVLSFGPFVGYHFKPSDPKDLTRLSLICFNEDNFYTNDLPENATLFTGEAVFARLPAVERAVAGRNRITPVFFSEAPEAWKDARPEPQEAFVHFHSCYDANGPVLYGFWIRHVGEAAFTYDMGGRVDESSPLHHEVMPGPDNDFPRIIEFDKGPESDRRSTGP